MFKACLPPGEEEGFGASSGQHHHQQDDDGDEGGDLGGQDDGETDQKLQEEGGAWERHLQAGGWQAGPRGDKVGEPGIHVVQPTGVDGGHEGGIVAVKMMGKPARSCKRKGGAGKVIGARAARQAWHKFYRRKHDGAVWEMVLHFVGSRWGRVPL